MFESNMHLAMHFEPGLQMYVKMIFFLILRGFLLVPHCFEHIMTRYLFPLICQGLF